MTLMRVQNIRNKFFALPWVVQNPFFLHCYKVGNSIAETLLGAIV